MCNRNHKWIYINHKLNKFAHGEHTQVTGPKSIHKPFIIPQSPLLDSKGSHYLDCLNYWTFFSLVFGNLQRKHIIYFICSKLYFACSFGFVLSWCSFVFITGWYSNTSVYYNLCICSVYKFGLILVFFFAIVIKVLLVCIF